MRRAAKRKTLYIIIHKIGAATGTMQKREGIQNFRYVSKGWLTYSVLWTIAHYSLGILAIVFSVAIASKKQLFPEQWPWFFGSEGFFSAVFSGLFAFLSAGDRGSRYRKAHRLLRNMIDKFDYDTTQTFNHVEVAHNQAASIIEQAPIQTAVPTTPQPTSKAPHE